MANISELKSKLDTQVRNPVPISADDVRPSGRGGGGIQYIYGTLSLISQIINRLPTSSGGGGGGGGGIFTYPNILFVGPGSDGAADDTDLNTPFITIQGAVDAIGGPPTSAEDQKQRYIILIAPGAYDENVVLPAARFIELLGLGPWVLGDGALDNFETTPGSERNLTIQTNSDAEFPEACRPTIVLGTLLLGETSSTHTANAVGALISGQILYEATGGSGTTVDLHLNQVKVVGDFDATGHNGALIIYLHGCYMDADFIAFEDVPGGVDGIIAVAESTEFDGLITISQVNRMVHCDIDGGMTYEGFTTLLPPRGLLGCDLRGAFTNTGGSPLELDALSNYYFVANGASVSNGKTLLHSLA